MTTSMNQEFGPETDPITNLFNKLDSEVMEQKIHEEKMKKLYEACYPVLLEHFIERNPLFQILSGRFKKDEDKTRFCYK